MYLLQKYIVWEFVVRCDFNRSTAVLAKVSTSFLWLSPLFTDSCLLSFIDSKLPKRNIYSITTMQLNRHTVGFAVS